MEVSKSIKFGTFLIFAAVLIGIWEGIVDYKKAKQQWFIRLTKDNIEDHELYGSTLQLQHLSEQTPQYVQIKVETEEGEVHTKPIDKITNFSLQHFLEIEKENIKSLLLNSSKKLNLKNNGRILTSIDKGKPFFTGVSSFIQVVICLGRNLTFVAILTNSFSLWLPLLLFIETFMMVGFWTHDVHHITDMYVKIFNSKIDLFNILRMMFSKNPSQSKISIINDYGYSSKFFANISGEVSVLVLLLIASIFIKTSNIFIKSEKIRSISSKIRPVWNGYICWMTPKLLTMAGLQFRGMTATPSGMDILNSFIATLTIIGIIVYLIFLIVQIRKINSKLQYIEESRLQIGMADRIDYMKDFQFDCLQYSMLYYPVMNQIRLTFGFLCVGFAPYFHYVQFGGVLAAQVFYLMMQISCSPYIKTKDKILYPVIDFFYSIYLLFLIGMGLVYQVKHYELTIKLETFLYSLLLAILIPLLLSISHDAIIACKERRLKDSEEEQKVEEEEKSDDALSMEEKKTQKKSEVKKQKKNLVKNSRKGKSEKSQKTDKENFKAEDLSDEQEDSEKTQNIFQDSKVKVKKVKKGKVI